MKNSLRIFLIAVSIFVLSCSKHKNDSLPYYNTPDFTPHWFSNEEAVKENLHTVSGFSFTNQDGKTITNETLKGKIYVANFFFTVCPTICPKMTNNLIKVQETFKNDNDVLLISHSVMSWMDSVSVLKSYEKKFNLQNGKWNLLTGKTSEIYSLARKSYFAEEEPGFNKDSTEFLHTEHILLVDKNGHLRGVYNGTLPLEIERLIDDVKLLKQE